MNYVFAAILSAFFFAVMNTLTSHKLSHLPSMTLVFCRGAFSVIILAPLVFSEIPKLLQKKSFPIHGRSLAGGLAILCLFWTLKNTTSLHASFLASLAPLFLSFILFLVDDNKLSFVNRAGLWLVIAGSLLVSWSPDFSASLEVWGIGMLGAFLSALAMFFLKKSTAEYSPNLIVFNLSFILVLLGFYSVDLKTIKLEDAGFLAAMCLSSVIAQILMTLSYKGLMPQVANGLGRSLIIWVALIELIMTHTLPGFYALSGYFLATVGVVALQWKTPR